MIYNQVELHNYEALINIPGRPGVLLQRIPEAIRIQLREEAQKVYRYSAGGEIRFVSEGQPVKIRLASYMGNSKAILYFGDFQVKEYILTEAEEVLIEVAQTGPGFIENPIFDDTSFPFSVKVWRLILSGIEIHLIDIEGTSLRPPTLSEIPRLRYLAYGTSITQGALAISPDLSYVKQVGWRLGADVINLGASGAANCEKAITDYITARQDWDFATLCLSINMLNRGASSQEFYEAAHYMVNTIAKMNPGKPIVCIGLLTVFSDLGFVWPERNVIATSEEYRKILKEIVEMSGCKNLYYVDGKKLLNSFYGLSQDLLHPGNNGMIEIGQKLSEFIKPLLGEMHD